MHTPPSGTRAPPPRPRPCETPARRPPSDSPARRTNVPGATGLGRKRAPRGDTARALWVLLSVHHLGARPSGPGLGSISGCRTPEAVADVWLAHPEGAPPPTLLTPGPSSPRVEVKLVAHMLPLSAELLSFRAPDTHIMGACSMQPMVLGSGDQAAGAASGSSGVGWRSPKIQGAPLAGAWGVQVQPAEGRGPAQGPSEEQGRLPGPARPLTGHPVKRPEPAPSPPQCCGSRGTAALCGALRQPAGWGLARQQRAELAGNRLGCEERAFRVSPRSAGLQTPGKLRPRGQILCLRSLASGLAVWVLSAQWGLHVWL